MTKEEVLKQTPCPYYARGNCRYGHHCQLKHESSSEPSNEQDKVCNKVDDCGICLEKVRCIDGNKYGLLTSCMHVFCYKCIMEWRKEGSREAKDRASCPTCRKHSDYVIPSPINPTNEQHKQRIISDYKRKLSQIPCKLFNGTLGSCRYGKDCLYSHKNGEGEDMKSEDKSMKELWENKRRRRSRSDSFDAQLMENFLFFLMAQSIANLQGGSDDDDDFDSSFSD